MPEDDLQERCRACHLAYCTSDKRAEEFGARFPGCECEAASISPHSPGPVGANEVLARFVFEPKHIGADGSIEVGALRDIGTNGLSTQRRLPDDAARLHEQGLDIAKQQNERSVTRALETGTPTPDPLIFRGIVELSVGRVRAHFTEGHRSFCVMDSAKPNDRLHADVITDGRRSKTQRIKLRNELRSLLLDVMPKDP